MPTPSPDPLEHLSDYEKQLLIAMVPTYHERERMRREGITPQSREALIIEFLLHRRGIYEHCFKQSCAAAGIEPPVVRNLMSTDRLNRYKSLMNQAAGAASEHRVPEADNDRHLKQYLRDDHDTAKRRRLKR